MSFLIFFCITLVSCATPYYKLYKKDNYAIASWYGREFHGRPTSSGEIFNMYALTCAHKEYPFGSILKVTNLLNNKTVKCVVNDRGPFVKGRDIDLSYAAAQKIGLIGQGITEVKIEYLGRDTRYVKEVKYISDTGILTIQVGSFKDFSNAIRLQRGLELKYNKVYIIETKIGGDRYYRVRIGKFYDRDSANNIASTLAKEGYDVLITRYD